MKNQWQYLTEAQRNELLNQYKNSKSCLMKHLLPGK